MVRRTKLRRKSGHQNGKRSKTIRSALAELVGKPLSLAQARGQCVNVYTSLVSPGSDSGSRYDVAFAESYTARIGFAGRQLAANKRGYNVTVLPPGKSAFSFHCHIVNEEMFFVIQAQAELRLGDALQPILAGDILACPPGGPEIAHHIVNTSEAALFLAVSTRLSPEVCEYPDTGRFGWLAEMPGATDGKPRELHFMGGAGESLEYWQGE